MNPRLAAMIRRQLYLRRGAYRLLAYSIMPNHVHIVLEARDEPTPAAAAAAQGRSQSERIPEQMDEQPDVRSPLVDYLRGLKSMTAVEAAGLPDGGVNLIWHDESFDYWVRSVAELDAIVNYVADNPVAAGLVRSPEQWFFSSVHDRFLHDGETCAWLPEADRT